MREEVSAVSTLKPGSVWFSQFPPRLRAHFIFLSQTAEWHDTIIPSVYTPFSCALWFTMQPFHLASLSHTCCTYTTGSPAAASDVCRMKLNRGGGVCAEGYAGVGWRLDWYEELTWAFYSHCCPLLRWRLPHLATTSQENARCILKYPFIWKDTACDPHENTSSTNKSQTSKSRPAMTQNWSDTETRIKQLLN